MDSCCRLGLNQTSHKLCCPLPYSMWDDLLLLNSGVWVTPVKSGKSSEKHAILPWVVWMAFLLTQWDQISVMLGFVSQVDRKELLVIFPSDFFLISNLWPGGCQEMGLQNCYFISHTVLRKERKQTDIAELILLFTRTDCVQRCDEDWALLQVTFALFLLEFSQYFIVAAGFSFDLHLFLLLPFC